MKFSTLLQFVTPHGSRLALIVLLLLAGSAAALAQPWLGGELVQAITAQPGDWLGTVRDILLALLALFALRSLIAFATGYLTGTTGEEMSARLRSRAYQHMQVLPLAWHQERPAGDTLALLTNDAHAISRFVTDTTVQLLPTLLTFAGALLLMAWLDPVIAGLAVVLMPLYYLATRLLGRGLRPVTRRWAEDWASKVALIQENIGLLPAIKAFGRERIERERFERRNVRLLETSRRQILLQSILGPSISFLAGAGFIFMLWVGIGHVRSGALDTGGLVKLVLYAMLLAQPLSRLAAVYGQLMTARGAAERLQEFFAEQPEPLEEDKPPLLAVRGRIEFRGLAFHYPGRGPLFENFELVIEPGEIVALTGPNGAGKSTLVHLLMRFMDPLAGAVLVDGTDIREVSLASLRDNVGLVAQNTLLLNGTVADNIRYGRDEATDADIKRAANAARASEFIEALPDGYGTLIGDQGVRLSGGQRQRLSLARTLVRDPAILVLDEATSMFDPEGERGFIEECRDVLLEHTVIMITHRPASLALAQRVLKLEQGRLA